MQAEPEVQAWAGAPCAARRGARAGHGAAGAGAAPASAPCPWAVVTRGVRCVLAGLAAEKGVRQRACGTQRATVASASGARGDAQGAGPAQAARALGSRAGGTDDRGQLRLHNLCWV